MWSAPIIQPSGIILRVDKRSFGLKLSLDLKRLIRIWSFKKSYFSQDNQNYKAKCQFLFFTHAKVYCGINPLCFSTFEVVCPRSISRIDDSLEIKVYFVTWKIVVQILTLPHSQELLLMSLWEISNNLYRNYWFAEHKNHIHFQSENCWQ